MKPEQFNDVFYPTPERLAIKMAGKIKGHPGSILEPSAGKGALIKAVRNKLDGRWGGKMEVAAIEIDPDLRAILRADNCRVIDSDFLAFAGPDKFDLIIANPPFDQGDRHLLKMIDVMYCGQIICLLNAETLKNPNTHSRRELVKVLDELQAEIEYIEGAFEFSERKTSVEIALVNITIERDISSDLFTDAGDVAVDSNEQIKDKHELTTGHTIRDMVAEYSEIVQIATDTIIGYYRNSKKIGKYIGLNRDPEKGSFSAKAMTSMVQNTLNDTLRIVRKDFWMKALELREVKERLTEARLKEFEQQIQDRHSMDFTENNVRSFILNVINGYNDTLTTAVLEIFDKFTVRHCFDDGLRNENIHLFNGWKTNKAFKVGKKVIIPVYASYGNPFFDYGKWKLDYTAARTLGDIDIVMAYFDGLGNGAYTIVQAMEHAFTRGQNSMIESSYFKITAYKKGTLHLTFTNMDVLRRFNVAACQGKGWLPNGYGQKQYADMPAEERTVVDTFEGKKSYGEHLGQKVFENSVGNLPLLMAA